jgi:hypothetical protein
VNVDGTYIPTFFAAFSLTIEPSDEALDVVWEMRYNIRVGYIGICAECKLRFNRFKPRTVFYLKPEGTKDMDRFPIFAVTACPECKCKVQQKLQKVFDPLTNSQHTFELSYVEELLCYNGIDYVPCIK